MRLITHVFITFELFCLYAFSTNSIYNAKNLAAQDLFAYVVYIYSDNIIQILIVVMLHVLL